MRLFVCGSRDYKNWPFLNRMLSTLHSEKGITCIINDHQSGAARLSTRWAHLKGLPALEIVTGLRHTQEGSDGLKRMDYCLQLGLPDLVLVVTKNPLTDHVLGRCRRGGIEVINASPPVGTGKT